MPASSITVVSGLPRSGTSMMMRVLEAGGIPPVTDEVREPDADNPNGYYEFERIKKVKENASWIGDLYGKAVKAIYLLLYDLPAGHTYRLVFMTRRLDEVIASQDTMLKRAGRHDESMDAGMLKRIFQTHLDKIRAWLEEQPNFDVLYVSYNAFMEDPATQCRRINEFLEGELDETAMLSVVDPGLYRQRMRQND